MSGVDVPKFRFVRFCPVCGKNLMYRRPPPNTGPRHDRLSRMRLALKNGKYMYWTVIYCPAEKVAVAITRPGLTLKGS
jgi:hypothetical protein